MLKINPQYLVDDKGEKTAALLTIKEFQLLMQRLEDLEDTLEMDAAVETDQAELMEYAEAQLRKLCDSRKLNWDKMSEADRENFVNDLIHEDRECSR
ncbi:hypothetical protein J4G08_02600 [Candidatus Poribacteria bacterium]|nr:hypothetical protein [Candidatus Poribacteria bacterium]